MLSGIDIAFGQDAISLLRWLTYAKSPPTLGELVHAAIIDPNDQAAVKVDDQGSIEDTLDILTGLIVVVGSGQEVMGRVDESESDVGDKNVNDVGSKSSHRVNGDANVRLVQFSVQEYLEPERIVNSSARDFAFEPDREHRILTQCCLAYLLHYHADYEK